MPDPDWTDPCAVYAWLNAMYPQIVAGKTVASTSHDGTSVTFSRSSIREFVALMRMKSDECAAIQGRPRRRAIIAG